MKKLFFSLFVASALLTSCGDSSSSSTPEVEPINVEVKDFYDVFVNHSDKALRTFEDFIDYQESGISPDDLIKKSDEIIKDMNYKAAEAKAHVLTGDNAKKLAGSAEKVINTASTFYNAIATYCEVCKKHADLLTKKDWDASDEDNFEANVLPTEDKVYNALDDFDYEIEQFYNEKEQL